jgi:hypothetical protein
LEKRLLNFYYSQDCICGGGVRTLDEINFRYGKVVINVKVLNDNKIKDKV